VKVKVFKHKNGYVISIGLDPEKHYNTEHTIPVAIFYNLDVMDPVLYAVLGEETDGIKDADNGIYVKASELDETLKKIQSFYEKFAELTGEIIHVNIIEVDKLPPKPANIRKLNILDEIHLKPSRE